MASGAIPGVVDALFESASGFTTTGASILDDIERVGAPLLFWRSFTQWLGGLGIVVLLVALLSELGPGARFLFQLEVPGPKAEVLHSRVQETASALLRIYLMLSLLQTGTLMVLGLGPYDALAHTFSTLSTGGFSPYQDSAAHFSVPVQVATVLFMLVAGGNFSIYYALLSRRDVRSFQDVELLFYLGCVAVVSCLIAFDVSGRDLGSGARLVLDSAFQVVSVVTTTGFATTDFDLWPPFSQALLIALMFAGGCAGSTAGGAKMIRVIVAWKTVMREVRLTFSPSSVLVVFVGRASVPEESARGVVGLVLLWSLAWGVGTVALSVGGVDLVTAATSAIATLSNVGPGLAGSGPTKSFAFFAPWQKLVMVLLMWLGRLEFFALVAVFQPRFWRR